MGTLSKTRSIEEVLADVVPQRYDLPLVGVVAVGAYAGLSLVMGANPLIPVNEGLDLLVGIGQETQSTNYTK